MRELEIFFIFFFFVGMALRINRKVIKYAKVTSWEEVKVQMSPGHHKLANC